MITTITTKKKMKTFEEGEGTFYDNVALKSGTSLAQDFNLFFYTKFSNKF